MWSKEELLSKINFLGDVVNFNEYPKKLVETTIKKFKIFSADKVVRKLEPELIESFNNLYLKAFEEQNSADERKRERGKILKQIEELELKDRLKVLNEKLSKLNDLDIDQNDKKK